MSSDRQEPFDATQPFRSFFQHPFFDMQGEAMSAMFSKTLPGASAAFVGVKNDGPSSALDPAELGEWVKAGTELQQMWLEFVSQRAQATAQRSAGAGISGETMLDPAQWLVISQGMLKQMPGSLFEAQAKLAQDTFEVWQSVLSRMSLNIPGLEQSLPPSTDAIVQPDLPRKDRRFSDPEWQNNPAFALLHQTYLMLAEYFRQSVHSMDALDDVAARFREKHGFRLRVATKYHNLALATSF